MPKYFKQNKNIIITALTIFMVSMSILLLFLNEHPKENEDIHANVMTSLETKSQQMLEESYRTVAHNEEDPIIAISLDGVIHFASWDFEKVTGYSAKELKGKLFFDLLNPEELSTFLAAFGKVIDTEKSLPMVGPYRLENAEGDYQFHIGSMYPILENGKITKIIITTRDITPELQKQEEGGKSNHPLGDKLASMP